MSNYTKTTNFTAKDSLPSGNANKKINGSLFDTEFDALATAVNSKANSAAPTFTGTVTAPTLAFTTATGTNLLTTAIKANDGTASATIADSTGVMTIASSVLTTTDINGGSIDGTTVGATTASTGNFSTLSINGTAITATAAELNILDGVTATAAELNALDGITATVTELNYTDGVTSAIQTQLDAKAPIASPTFTGTTTIPTADINGGTIDGVTIGGSSAGAGTFTTFTSTGIDDNASATALTIDSSGRVGIGTSSPNTKLDVIGSTTNGSGVVDTIRMRNTGATLNDGPRLQFTSGTSTSGAAIASEGKALNSADLLFYAGGNTERMRIDSSGIVTISSGYIGQGDTMLLFASSVDAIVPRGTGGAARDNAIDLGNATNRFDDIYATNGTIQTSDEREKQDIEELSQAEQNVAVAAKGLLRKFRWKDAVAEKGDDARIHFGIMAQDLKAAFEAEGLDAGRYAMFINSEWWETYTDVPAVEAQDAVLDEEGNVVTEAVEAKEAYTRTDTYFTEEEAPEGAVKKDRMGIRYNELLAFIIAAI